MKLIKVGAAVLNQTPLHKQFIRVNYMPYITHTFIWLPISVVPPHHKQFI
jgi:hypothetical protein